MRYLWIMGRREAPEGGRVEGAFFLNEILAAYKFYAWRDIFYLLQGDVLEILSKFPSESVDMIFADPPYHLSNDGITCYAGRRVKVNKGEWDRSKGFMADVAFHRAWIAECRRILKKTGTIWISGTAHSIFQCGYLLQELGFHILNDICWYKPNAAPNISCNTFAHAHEILIWAKKDKAAKHFFNYELMKNGAFPEDKMKVAFRQMRSVWSIPTPTPKEKKWGKHPTQKPLALLRRIVLASTREGDLILDPFNGSGTTGIAAMLVGHRRYIGIDIVPEYLTLTGKRLEEITAQGKLF